MNNDNISMYMDPASREIGIILGVVNPKAIASLAIVITIRVRRRKYIITRRSITHPALSGDWVSRLSRHYYEASKKNDNQKC